MNLSVFALVTYFSGYLVFMLCIFLLGVKRWDNFPSVLFNFANLSISFVRLVCKSSMSNFLIASL